MSGIKAAVDPQTASLQPNSRREKFNERSESRAESLRVLVVDDDGLVRDAVAAILKARGYRVSRAGDAFAAMSRLAANRYDLVITDLQMPFMDGYRLSVWLKREAPGTRVVVMTGRCQSEIAKFAETGLVDGWIFKPFGIDELYGTINQFDPAG